MQSTQEQRPTDQIGDAKEKFEAALHMVLHLLQAQGVPALTIENVRQLPCLFSQMKLAQTYLVCLPTSSSKSEERPALWVLMQQAWEALVYWRRVIQSFSYKKLQNSLFVPTKRQVLVDEWNDASEALTTAMVGMLHAEKRAGGGSKK